MISFIVPAHNEAGEIGACLEAITTAATATARPWELIVVDDASTDDTAAIARDHHARVVHVEHRQIAATRNAGAVIATGDRLVFVDADTRVTPAVVGGAMEALDAGAVGGGAGVAFEGPLPRLSRIMLPPLLAVWRLTGYAAGCFVYATREDFQAVGGFDERYYASEEVHFSRAMKRRGRFVVLKDCVETSGRKARLYTPWEQLRTFFRMLFGGFRAVRRREGLEMWYDGRRERPAGLNRTSPSGEDDTGGDERGATRAGNDQ